MNGGFHFRLDNADSGPRLFCGSWSRMVSGSEEHHEITESGIRSVAGRP